MLSTEPGSCPIQQQLRDTDWHEQHAQLKSHKLQQRWIFLDQFIPWQHQSKRPSTKHVAAWLDPDLLEPEKELQHASP